MGIEVPTIAAFVSRMEGSETQLAAFGGVIFPLALLIEAPIIMMLAASTSLSRDLVSFRALRRFMTRLGIALTLIHIAIVATPVFEWIARDLLRAPEETIGPARLGFAIVIPWTWAIADRRFHQGVLIRFGHQRQVGVGTAVRLAGTILILSLGLANPGLPGAALAGVALTCGVLLEATYARIAYAVLVRGDLAKAKSTSVPLTSRGLWAFYIPLAMSPLLALMSQPIGAAGIGRMANPTLALAIWPVVNGLGFMMRSAGVAFNEVTVRHAGTSGGRAILGRMAWLLGVGCSSLLLLIAATPLAHLWFAKVSALSPELTSLARQAIWWAVPMPLLSFLHSYYQGLLVEGRRTRGITEAVAVFLVTTTIALTAFVIWQPLPGASAALAAMALGGTAQAMWLRLRCWHAGVVGETPELRAAAA